MKKIDFKKLFMISIGATFLVCGLNFFLIPNNLAVGGATGMAVLLSHVFTKFDTGQILFVLNILLFVLGFKILGANFGFYTIYGALYLAVILSLLEKFFPITRPLTDDLLINVVFGVALGGIGTAIVINQGASTGGTDILAKIIQKYSKLSFGASLMLIDGLVTFGAAVIFSPTHGMYSLLGVIINSLVIDRLLQGFDSKFAITIISEQNEVINEYVLKELNRGTTVYQATGGFSKSPKTVITTILDKRSYVKLKDYVKTVDSRAFVYVSNASEVEGEGFTFDLIE